LITVVITASYVVIVFPAGGSFVRSSSVRRLCRPPARPGGSTSPLSLRARSLAAVHGSRRMRHGVFAVSQVKLMGLLRFPAAFLQIGCAPIRTRPRAPAPALRSVCTARLASSRRLSRGLQRSAPLLLAPLPCAPVQASASSAFGSRGLRPLPCALLRGLRAAPPWRPVLSPPAAVRIPPDGRAAALLSRSDAGVLLKS
jgi:hypothetical protein